MTSKAGRMNDARPVVIGEGSNQLNADLTLPEGDPQGLVLFAHGSGSSRFSSRNRQVASSLVSRGMATLMLDLLTEEEEREDVVTREFRFDIPMLAGRLVGALDWMAENGELAGLPAGLFGASTGAGAALIAAAERPARVAAVVSRGGRPDLAGEALVRVRAPTLLIVGGNDTPVIGMNRDAASQMQCQVRTEVVPGATHLFEEPGKLETVSELASDWFLEHFQKSLRPRPAFGTAGLPVGHRGRRSSPVRCGGRGPVAAPDQ
ncbi:dienelactone hydrolase family protein [Marinobacter salicampi]|uniref:dienelactone hydrolase family protein n=1 Tax=Marinobacter salicampi TaxID=435907 RepID=UPI001408ADE5|nr:dienelactone hydrolase family protein [Marinobacter salicampi]